MANTYWLGTATAVAQVATASIDSVDGTPADNTFTVTIGGVTVSAVGDTDVATTAANLLTSLNAETHPYFAAITWTNPSAGNITGTADTAGVPFVAALTETGAGTGAVTDFSDDTASSGPNDWSTAANWSEGSVPGASDDVVIADSSINISWGLAQGTIALTSLTVKKTYTGKIGLDYRRFATSSDADTYNESAIEYRETHLTIESTTVDLGEHNGQGNPTGSGRICLDLDSGTASTVTVHSTANNPSETGRGAVRLLVANASTDIIVRSAPGGVTIAGETPGETATVRKISVTDASTGSKVVVAPGTTLTTWYQRGGTNAIRAAATITTITVDGGVLTLEGSYIVTTANVNDGTVIDNHISGTNAIATLNLDGGTVDTSNSGRAQTYATVNISGTGTLKANADDLTITTLAEPSSGKYSLTAA